jgi:hypothetical protein
MDHIITEAEARKLLEPYRARLLKCILAGWERWQELLYSSPGHFTTTRATSRANLVYDYIVEAAKKEFLPGGQPEPHVRVSEKHGFLTLTFHDRIVVRFKKFRSRGLWPSGIPTRQQQLFAFQLPMENMPTEVTKAVAGYLLNSLQDEIERGAGDRTRAHRAAHSSLDTFFGWRASRPGGATPLDPRRPGRSGQREEGRGLARDQR